MRTPFWLLMLTAAVAPFGAGGCRSCCRPACYPPPAPVAGRSLLLPPHPLTPGPGCPPPAVAAVPPGPAPSAPPTPGFRAYEPPRAQPAPEPEWRPSAPPAGPGVRLNEPVPDAPAPPRDGVRLLVPQPSAPPKPAVTEDKTPAPTPALPSGIPQFAQARPRVATGLRPHLDGLDWLKDQGYKTVVHLRAPGEDNSADRAQVEKRGLRYVGLEVSPRTLSRTVVEEFNHVVTDAASQPVFVYDKEGALAGGLWYLHFRIVESAGADEARAKATRLGLKDNGDGLHKEMWLAVQNYLDKAQE
jgi:protein tyrosine phosphatase (PTP) superfamily phosphohydrolase (DUF442 family)